MFENEETMTKNNLSMMSNQDLDTSLGSLVRSERKRTHIILMHIQIVESRRSYLEFGFTSTFEYLTLRHGYDESGAYRRIQSARLLAEIPAIRDSVEQGTLKLSQLSKVQTVLKAQRRKQNKVKGADSASVVEEAKLVLSLLENKTLRQTDAILSQKFDLPLQTPEIEKHQRDDTVRFELTLNKTEFELLSAARNRLSHENPDSSWKSLILLMAGKVLKQFDKNTKRNRVLQNSGYCCEYVQGQTGKKCGQKIFLQVDHRVPRARGGSDRSENLRVLCHVHNLSEARAWGLHWDGHSNS